MWYMPYLRVRHAVFVYGLIVVGISLAAVALRLWPGAVHLDSRAGQQQLDMSAFFVAAVALVGGLATVLGLNLAAENDGHLEVAWTRPISREGYALRVFAVDIGAMVVCIAFTTVCVIAVVDIYAGHQAATFGSLDTVFRALAFCGLPLCVYAWIAALSASLKRNRGTVAGLFWPVMIALGALPLVPVAAVHAVATTLNLLNPLMIYGSSSNVPSPTLWTYAWGWAVAAVLLVVAILQWRRLEL